MELIDLVDRSAAIALEHASRLSQRLQAMDDLDPAVAACRADMHLLVSDIVSLRNAAELLKRELPAD